MVADATAGFTKSLFFSYFPSYILTKSISLFPLSSYVLQMATHCRDIVLIYLGLNLIDRQIIFNWKKSCQCKVMFFIWGIYEPHSLRTVKFSGIFMSPGYIKNYIICICKTVLFLFKTAWKPTLYSKSFLKKYVISGKTEGHTSRSIISLRSGYFGSEIRIMTIGPDRKQTFSSDPCVQECYWSETGILL
jgi:hypothetical protein